MEILDVARVEEWKQEAEKLVQMYHEAQSCIDWIQSKIDSYYRETEKLGTLFRYEGSNITGHSALRGMLDYQAKLKIAQQGVLMNYSWLTSLLPIKLGDLEPHITSA